MRIDIEIPDWAEERHVRIFAGIEMVAYKEYGTDQWKIKSERCNSCGECCKNIKPSSAFPFQVIDGVCEHLKDNECDLKTFRPFSCCASRESKAKYDYCSVEYQ